MNKSSFKIKSKKWKKRDVILLLERLELYISSGLVIDKALEIVCTGVSSRQKACIDRVHLEITSGSLLSKSLRNNIGLSATLSGLIEHGESSGELARALTAARRLVEKEDELIKRCTSALAYPVIIAVFSGLLTIGLVRGVMPQIIPMLKSLHVQLPLLTRIVMAVSENITLYGLYILIGAVLVFLAFSFSYKKLKLFRSACHSVMIRIPIVGSLYYRYSLSLFLQSCGALVESGLQVGHSFANTAATISLIPLYQILLAEIPQVQKGVSVGQVFFNKSRNIPVYVPSLLIAGEASGTLGASFIRAASIIDRDMDHSIKRLTSLIEPVMMAGMGMVVGGIALSIMMPIYDISKVLQH